MIRGFFGWMQIDQMSASASGSASRSQRAAAIGAAIAALGGADIDGVGMFRMDGDRVDLGPFRQPAGQMLPAVLARGLAEDPAQGSAHRPRRAGVNMCRRHDLLPPLKSNGDHTPPPPLAAKF